MREPDYVSGVSLAIRRELFDELGGFDAHFALAYYEGVDLAFRVRAAGFGVYYQPLSRAVHFEGVSSGMDENAATGMKRFQALNRQKLVDRWCGELGSHGERGEDLEHQKERRIQRRAFVVDVYMLTPDKESRSLRVINLFAILQELGFKVTFAAANLEAPEPYVSNLQMRGVECVYRPYVKSVTKHLATHGDMYDLVILSRADAAAQVMSAARRDIMFIGAFAHPPNADGVLWLAEEILPMIHVELPDLCCHVIGANPPPQIRALADDRMKIHGFVPDVTPFFRRCRLSVAPLRYGAGVKGKVNQSLAHGLPMTPEEGFWPESEWSWWQTFSSEVNQVLAEWFYYRHPIPFIQSVWRDFQTLLPGFVAQVRHFGARPTDGPVSDAHRSASA